MRCFHPEKLMQEIRSFIAYFLGQAYIEPPPFDFGTILKQTTKTCPTLFMVGPNVNTYVELSIYREIQSQTLGTQIDYQPLGAIEHERISKLIIRSACAGNWLLLDNLQLSIEIIPNLQKFVETMYELHDEAKDKLTDLCKVKLETEIRTKMEQGKSTAEDALLLEELKRVALRVRKKAMRKRRPVRGESEGSLSESSAPEELAEPDEDDEDEAIAAELLQQQAHRAARMPDQLKGLRKKMKDQERARIIAELDAYAAAQKEADAANEPYELTVEEKNLRDLVFPEALMFPIHRNFRLWLGTIPSADFPSNFARRCLKVSLELPTALRPNAQKSLSSVTPRQFQDVDRHQREFRRLLFSMTVMHAAINKRAKFGSFGWTQPYHFSPTDFAISVQMLSEMCNSLDTEAGTPFPEHLLRYLVAELNYGGKLTNDDD